MVLVERHFIKGNKQIEELCGLSKELYNKCNYLMRQAWFKKERLPDLGVLNELLKNEEEYNSFKNTKIAKQVLRKCLTDWSNYRKALNAYKKDSKKFNGPSKPPGYKKKMAQVIFYEETIRRKPRMENILKPTNDCFEITSKRKFKQVVITPKTFGFLVEVQYEVATEPIKKKKKDKFCCIDLGVNNLCTITSDQFSPILINGRIVKSFNQYFNKSVSKKSTKKRYFRMENYFHHVSKYIMELCKIHNLKTIIIGKNDGWKQGVKMRKVQKQNFLYIPFNKLIEKIKYKSELSGIEFLETEESYTSKASFLDRDTIPVYRSGDSSEKIFSGSRIKRGLYRSNSGILLNADANGSANIGRKIMPESAFSAQWDRSVAATPTVVNPLRK